MAGGPLDGAVEDEPWLRLPELVDWDEASIESHWAAVDELLASADESALIPQACTWCGSVSGPVQALGVEVLGELARTSRAALEHLLAVTAFLIDSEDEDVRWSVAVSLRYAAKDWRSTDFLLRLFDDVDGGVRFQALQSIGLSDDEDPRSPDVTEALLRAQRDPDPDLRDWATFTLGVLRHDDTPSIRAALVTASEDLDEGVAAEAARGLALRHDTRVLPILVRQLLHSQVDDRYVDAAEELGDRSLGPLLLDLRAGGWADTAQRADALESALRACGVDPA